MVNEKKILENIKFYFNYQRNQINIISNLKVEDYDRIYKKLLFSSMIDALSRIVYPRKGSRDRFIEFVKKFGDWKEGNNVSLTHLIRLITKCPEPEFQDLRKLAYAAIKDWSSGELVTLDRDIDFNLALSKFPKEKSFNKIFDEVNLISLQHYSLLYAYRNSLVHEFRPPSSDFDRSYHDFPFYMHLTKMKSEYSSEEAWILNYPVQFYIWLTNNCINNLEAYLIENKLDPYNYYVFGDYWLENFNN